MEQDIENWIGLWEEKKSTPIDLEALINQLNKLEKHYTYSYITNS